MILLGLGANLPSRFGKPDQTIYAAYRAIEQGGINIEHSSRIWLTQPVPVSDQPWFYNTVIQVKTVLSPTALHHYIKSIEEDFGRIRTERNAARLLDIDLLAYDGAIIETSDLAVPHPRMHQRNFVLSPLLDIAPDWRHPVLGMTAKELSAALSDVFTARPMAEEAA